VARVRWFSANICVKCKFLPAKKNVLNQLQLTVAFGHKFDISFKDNITNRVINLIFVEEDYLTKGSVPLDKFRHGFAYGHSIYPSKGQCNYQIEWQHVTGHRTGR
jgi:hypothetical protein